MGGGGGGCKTDARSLECGAAQRIGITGKSANRRLRQVTKW
jgi:hypothetical protein